MLAFPDPRIRAYYDNALPYCCRHGCPREDCGWQCPLLLQEFQELGLTELLALAAEERVKRERCSIGAT